MSAPSFSSFPPSFASFPDAGPSSGLPREKEKKREKKHKHHRKQKNEEGSEGEADRRRRKKHREDRHSEGAESTGARRRSRSRSHSPTRSKRHSLVDDERRKEDEDRSQRQEHPDGLSVKEGLVYFTDRKGDPLNVRYGGLNAGDVPKYRLVGHGRKVLGLSPALSVVHRGRGGLEVGPFGRRKMPALTDSSTLRLLVDGPKRTLLASSEDKYKYREEDGFLRISTNKPRTETQTYREIELSKQAYDSDESEHSDNDASSDEDSDTTPLTSSKSTITLLEERLAHNPCDVSTWISLLSHSLSNVPITSKNASRARNEISLSILKKALSAHPDNGRSTILRLKYLRAGEELWEDAKLLAEWEDAIKMDSTELWMSWLDWRVRHAHDLLDTLVDDFTRIARALMTRGDETGLLRAQWRTAVALRDAGYIERANALLQAQAEILFHIPPQLSSKSWDDQLEALEEFWDAEVPRMGEPAASGWASWEASKRAEQSFPPSRTNVDDVSHVEDLYSRWAASETSADRTCTISLRSADDDESSDPFAIVLFSDIRTLLLPLRTRDAKDVFRRMWLAVAGLVVPGFIASLSQHPGENSDDRWAHSSLVSSTCLASIFPADTSARQLTADAQAGVLIGREREFASGFGPVKDWTYETIAPLEALGSHNWTMWSREDVQEVDVAWVREIFKQCKLPGDGGGWDVLNLAFEAAVNAKGALKVSKKVLAGAPDSLLHWAAHARLESLRSRLDDARKVYQTVLTAPFQERPGEAALWWDWAHMEWLARNNDAATQVILHSSGVEGSGRVRILRAKRYFETLLTQQLLQASSREREPWIKISGLLELLTSSLQSSLALFDSYIDCLGDGTPAQESLTVASLAMLYNHATVLRNPTPPAILRERVERAVEMYPNNTAILGMFLEAEKGQGIWGRVRAMLGETAVDGTGKEKTVAKRVAEVWVAGWEKGRWEAEIERVRSGLSTAVENDRTRGSAILWKLYVMFEIRAGKLEQAKKALYRALGECPLVKELYLIAFGPLRTVFDERELHQLADTMAERGIRMRVGLDEVAGEVDDNKEEDGDVESGEEDEIEYKAREQRRLMPY
ncbi:NRDE-2, necessary for RNA interference-domain-containing protein [Daedaleopsis nitida]|nr:NRDE-2, necessary for RNA interference-domain-containing protein [Daedaleopsis nitida]